MKTQCDCPGGQERLARARRAFLLAAGGSAAATAMPQAWAQVSVGESSVARNLVPAEQLEQAGAQQYGQLIEQARAKKALAGPNDPQLKRLRAIAQRIIPFAPQWNARAAQWKWEVNLIGSKQINAFCMPGGKIAFFTGILDQLKLTDDEVAMVMGHEVAHALREHAREQMAKKTGTGLALSIGAQLLGLGQLGDLAARGATQLLSLQFSRSDESDADLVGLELAARAGFDPRASVTLWEKMGKVAGDGSSMSFLSTHPSGPDRIAKLQANVPRVMGLYEAARPR
ncbi:M48 family metallopeptidase [Variovorax dokdonensis]|uniref:M48 family metallopeptidase n=1 Tax=Variovorax dokdonensis TaxID=344883 RepID=A0ABT7NFD2_9BURK|nr:M48 family metallopeptidase [Variovorax dokdonensis]MDM0046535.1 M48 family metallopeptidase [Variovorax dokdonensis]